MPSRRAPSVEHPLLPAEANTMLAIVVYLFASGGAISLLFIVVGTVGKLAGWEFYRGVEVHIGGVILRVVVAAGYLWTAWLIDRRRRLGGVLGLTFLGLSIVPRLLVGGPVASSGLLIPILGVVAIAFSWTHLSDAGVSAE